MIRGTGRWFSKEVGDKLEPRLGTVAKDIAAGHDCTGTIDYVHRYPATLNEARAAGQAGLRIIEAEPSMASDDFAFMLETVSGDYG